MFNRLLVRGAVMIAVAAVTNCPSPATAAEPKWESLLPAVDPHKDGVGGSWKMASGSLNVGAAERSRLMLPVVPPAEYDLRVAFTRKTGRHSVGLVVVHGGTQTAFEVDAWGSHLGGFQNVDGKAIRENPTRKEGVTLENGKRHVVTVEVRKDSLRGLLDDKEISRLATAGRTLSLSDFWTLPDAGKLGLIAWDSAVDFHQVEIRVLGSEPLKIARRDAPDSKPAPSAPASKPGTTASSPATTSPNAPSTGTKPAATAAGKRVLIVIANHHFFYREYSEPRQELERAGVKVTVAAGRRGPCRPHDGTGQGNTSGIVQAELALSEVKASDYDALLFSGGWGASAYQFAFPGRYNDPAYNGEQSVKTQANRLINEFLAQDKYVCALCNGVSVLAWARVDGKSPVAGKRVCAPTREAAAGIYNGRPAQPSCRWHPEQNGAILSPAGSIGRPGTPVDDVLVDGKIITGEDDPSAREMGRKIVEVLSSAR